MKTKIRFAEAEKFLLLKVSLAAVEAKNDPICLHYN